MRTAFSLECVSAKVADVAERADAIWLSYYDMIMIVSGYHHISIISNKLNYYKIVIKLSYIVAENGYEIIRLVS